MKIDVERLSPEELTEVAEQSAERLGLVRDAVADLPGAQERLAEAVRDREQIGELIRERRAEVERLENIIKPKRRRKTEAAKETGALETPRAGATTTPVESTPPKPRRRRA
jgi:dephospho-CoA kinase